MGQGNRADVELLQNLEYGKVRLVAAVPKSWNDINSFVSLLEKFLSNGKSIRISTEYLNITASYIQNNSMYRRLFGDLEPLTVTPWWRKGQNSKVAIFLLFGATEAKPPGVADAIVDVAETGTSLEQNNLRSSTFLIANKNPCSLKNGRKFLT